MTLPRLKETQNLILQTLNIVEDVVVLFLYVERFRSLIDIGLIFYIGYLFFLCIQKIEVTFAVLS
jgi:hypothetical protein